MRDVAAQPQFSTRPLQRTLCGMRAKLLLGVERIETGHGAALRFNDGFSRTGRPIGTNWHCVTSRGDGFCNGHPALVGATENRRIEGQPARKCERRQTVWHAVARISAIREKYREARGSNNKETENANGRDVQFNELLSRVAA